MPEPKSHDAAAIAAGVLASRTSHCPQKSSANVALINAHGPANARK